jgi:hypothetical protein
VAKRNEKYEDRIIVFLDFLGFRDIVGRTNNDRGYLHHLLQAIDRLSSIGKSTSDISKSHRITQFSDSLVLSYHVNEQSGVFHLLLDVAFAIIDLAGWGFLLRGAVTSGRLIHSDKYLLGPAMVRAYDFESKVAKYPRVLIDPGLIDIAQRAHASHHSGEHEVEHVSQFYARDFDKKYFFDYVSFQSVVEHVGMDRDTYPEYLVAIGRMVLVGLKNRDPRVLEKYLWLHAKYVKTIEVIEKLSPRHRFRHSEPEIVEAIEGLPKFNALASRARRSVDAAKRKAQRARAVQAAAKRFP